MKNETLTEFGELPVGSEFDLDGTRFKKTSERAAHIKHSPRQPRYNGIGPFMFGGSKPVKVIPSGTAQ